MADITPADMIAMSDRHDNGFLEGNGIIILLLFFLFLGGGSGFSGFGNAATQGALTRAELSDGFNMAEIQRNQADLKSGLCGLDQQIMQSRYDAALGNGALAQQVMQNRYDNALQMQTLQAQMAQCCCDMKTATHAEGEATRALITSNTIQELRDQLQAAQLTLGNASQTQTIISALSPRYSCSACSC